MDITTEYRSHWISADGTRHPCMHAVTDPSKPCETTRLRDVQPVLNMEELRAYADLGDLVLPQGGLSSQWFARQLLANPKACDRYHIESMCQELTDLIPHYNERWRAAFVALRNRWPGVDGKPCVAYVDTLPK